MTPEQMRWLTWGAIQHRPHGAPRWDEPGTAKAIADHCAAWDLATATEHVLAHARDPKARTPFAIKGNPPHTEHRRTPRFPAKAGEDCPAHPGEWLDGCRACASDRLAGVRTARPQEAAADVSGRVAALRAMARDADTPPSAPDPTRAQRGQVVTEGETA